MMAYGSCWPTVDSRSRPSASSAGSTNAPRQSERQNAPFGRGTGGHTGDRVAAPIGGYSRVPLSADGYAPRLRRAAAATFARLLSHVTARSRTVPTPQSLTRSHAGNKLVGPERRIRCSQLAGGRSHAPHHAWPGAWQRRGRQPAAGRRNSPAGPAIPSRPRPPRGEHDHERARPRGPGAPVLPADHPGWSRGRPPRVPSANEKALS